jgi:ABC-2 type transport system ATP-binding protein
MSARAPRHAVVAEGLRKQYGDVTALDGLDLTVEEGTVCGVLGPNGAGKTTAVRILATLVRPDAGAARVAGFDVATEAEQVRYRIGLTGQNAAVDEVLTGRDNLVMFGRLYHLSRVAARQRADELLARFDLTEAGGRAVKNYSGGMRRRLDLAASLVVAPAVLFLDEPTTGLDPRSRNGVWESIRELVAAGTSVLLTTQYLEEADQLADHIAVIDHGRTIAAGTPTELKRAVGGEQVDLVVRDHAQLPDAALALRRTTGRSPEIVPDERRLTVEVTGGVATLTDVLRELETVGIDAEDVALRRPTMDEVFLRLTGAPADTPAPLATTEAAR